MLIEGVYLLDKIRKSEVRDNKIVKIVEEIKKIEVKMLKNKKWKESKLILRDRKCQDL